MVPLALLLDHLSFPPTSLAPEPLPLLLDHLPFLLQGDLRDLPLALAHLPLFLAHLPLHPLHVLHVLLDQLHFLALLLDPDQLPLVPLALLLEHVQHVQVPTLGCHHEDAQTFKTSI